MRFTKMHGCGNDYVFINLFEEKIDNPKMISKRISDRHYGIGSDGLITIGPSNNADFKMCIYNSDGSEAEMCGNGIRCVGKYVFDNGLTNKNKITIETLSGIKELKLNIINDKVNTIEVDMGIPLIKSKDIPTVIDRNIIVSEEVKIDENIFNITCVSMGNPHTILFVNDITKIEIEKYGELIENSKLFPNKTNVEFVKVISRDEIAMRVWERGSKETWACTTGACAAVTACVLNGKTDNQVLVHLRGGDIKVTYDINEHIIMEGEAKKVYVGEYVCF